MYRHTVHHPLYRSSHIVSCARPGTCMGLPAASPRKELDRGTICNRRYEAQPIVMKRPPEVTALLLGVNPNIYQYPIVYNCKSMGIFRDIFLSDQRRWLPQILRHQWLPPTQAPEGTKLFLDSTIAAYVSIFGSIALDDQVRVALDPPRAESWIKDALQSSIVNLRTPIGDWVCHWQLVPGPAPAKRTPLEFALMPKCKYMGHLEAFPLWNVLHRTAMSLIRCGANTEQIIGRIVTTPDGWLAIETTPEQTVSNSTENAANIRLENTVTIHSLAFFNPWAGWDNVHWKPNDYLLFLGDWWTADYEFCVETRCLSSLPIRWGRELLKTI